MAYKKIPRSQLSEEELERQRVLSRASYRRQHAKHPERNAAYGKAYRARHHARVLAAQRAKREADPEGYRAYQKQWRDKHPEKVRTQALARYHKYFTENPEPYRARERAARAKRKALTGTTTHPGASAYRARNKLVISAKFKRYRQEHLATIKAQYKAWAQAHPEKVRANCAKRRARLANAPINDFTTKEWRALCKATGYRCAYCDQKFTFKELQQDHITPLSKGGSHTLANIVPACKSCNSRKRDKDVLKPVQPFLLLFDEDAAD